MTDFQAWLLFWGLIAQAVITVGAYYLQTLGTRKHTLELQRKNQLFQAQQRLEDADVFQKVEMMNAEMRQAEILKQVELFRRGEK